MKSFQIIGNTKDYRTNTNVLYAQILISEYFELIGDNYNKFQLQRKKENHPGYVRLKNDLESGALIPGITLAIEPSRAGELIPLIEGGNGIDISGIQKKLEVIKDNIYILDGLQRTHKIKELIDADVIFNKDQKLLLEIWVEPEITHLVYRLIVLNSGQKPMSMRHQIELLFTTMRVSISNEIEDLEILVENEHESRKRANQIPFERLVTAYYSYLTKNSEVDKSSIVSKKIVEEKIMDGSEEYLAESFSTYTTYLKQYCEIDKEVFRIYDKSELKSYRNWFADANVINSFFSSLGKLHESKKDRISKALQVLINLLKQAKKGTDPLKLAEYKQIREEVADPKLYNVGFGTRLLLAQSFDEYFRDEGDRTLHECWIEISNGMKKPQK